MKQILCILLSFTPILFYGQDNKTTKTLRLNIINPGIEYEHPMSTKSTIATNIGIGIPGSHKNQDITGGWHYYVAPFLDLSYRRFYNRENRLNKKKNLAYNSGNYWSLRFLTNFKEIYTHNITRTDDISFSVGPTWGLQRTNGKVHFLLDIGPVYYFDTNGNDGFFPFMIQLNLGYNLLSSK